MNRRSFIRISMAGAATSIFTPEIVLASTNQEISKSNMAGGIYYTKASPGRWAEKAGSHSPIIQKTNAGLRVVTGHPMILHEHWIIKHVLLDQDFNFITENVFNPHKDKEAISDFAKSEMAVAAAYALSVCNKHDTWVTAIDI